MRLFKRLSALLALIVSLQIPVAHGTGAGDEYVPREVIEAVAARMTEQCPATLTAEVCQCMSEAMEARAETRDYRLTRNEVMEAVTVVGEECVRATGYMRALMDRAYVTCYTGRPLQGAMEGEDLATLETQYPEKVEKCSCYQEAIDAMDEETFAEIVALSYQTYKRRTECLHTATIEECRERHPTAEKVRALDERCGM